MLHQEAGAMLLFRMIVIGALTLLSLDATAEENEKCGPYDSVNLTNNPVELEKVLLVHVERPVVVDPRRTNLCGANLSGADLSKADLINTDLLNAKLTNAKFYEARYEPASAPLKGYVSGIQGLRYVLFDKGKQEGLVRLRAVLKEAGLRELDGKPPMLSNAAKPATHHGWRNG